MREPEAFATERIANPEDRSRLLGVEKGALAGSIQKGELLPAVNLRKPKVIRELGPSATIPRDGPRAA